MAKIAATIVGGNNQIAPNLYTAAADPGVADDTSAGYNPHDVILNTTTRVFWRCVSNALGAAVWMSISPEFRASAQPSTGSWVIGDFVRNTAPVEAGTGGSKYVVLGWVRLTTGSGNVATTDWVPVRTLTGN